MLLSLKNIFLFYSKQVQITLLYKRKISFYQEMAPEHQLQENVRTLVPIYLEPVYKVCQLNMIRVASQLRVFLSTLVRNKYSLIAVINAF